MRIFLYKDSGKSGTEKLDSQWPTLIVKWPDTHRKHISAGTCQRRNAGSIRSGRIVGC